MRRLSLLFAFLPLLCSALPVKQTIEAAAALVDTRPDSALAVCRAMLPRLAKHTAERALCLHTEGNAHFSLGDVARAKTVFREAVGEARAAKDTVLLAGALRDLGVALRVSDRPDSALVCYQQALALYAATSDADGEAHLLTSIAVLYANTGRTKEAIPYARSAYKKARAAGEMETVMYAGGTLGIILWQGGHHSEGLDVERDMVRVAESKGLPRYQLKIYASIIDMHHKDGRPDSVQHYMEKGRQLLRRVPGGSVEALGFMEEEYVVLADMGRYRESLDIQLRILGMKDAGAYMPMDKLWLRMARNYSALGERAHADAAYERAIAIADSLRAAEIDAQLSEADVRWQTADRERRIASLAAEAAQSRARLTAGAAAVAVAAIVGGGVLLWRRQRRRRQEELARTRARLEGIEQERARLAKDLHDGVCNDLLGLALDMQRGAISAPDTLGALERVREDVRQIARELMPPQFTAVPLAMLLADYAAKQHGYVRFQVQPQAPEPTEEAAYQLYRMVQELVANTRQHSRATSVELVLGGADGTLRLCLDDDAPTPVSDVPHTGIGRETLASRARTIGARLDISRTEKGNRAEITLRV